MSTIGNLASISEEPNLLPVLVWGFGLLLLVSLGIGIAGWRMRRQGRPVFAEIPEDAFFYEKHRHAALEIWGGENQFLIALTPDELVVKPHYPYSLLNRERVTLHLRRDQVHDITVGRRLVWGPYVELFYDGPLRRHRLRLYPRRIRRFHEELLAWKAEAEEAQEGR